MNPDDIIGHKVQIMYQMYDGRPAQIWMGRCVAVDPLIILEHEGPQFLSSYLRPERIVSIHVLKGAPHDRAGEDVPERTHPRTA